MKVIIGDVEITASTIVIDVVGRTPELAEASVAELIKSVLGKREVGYRSLGMMVLREDGQYEREVHFCDYAP